MADDLGRMSMLEIMKAEHSGARGSCNLCEELAARHDASMHGRAGETAIASRAQVREAADKVNLDDLAEGNTEYGEGYFAGWRACRKAFARALLGLSPDAPSPLEDSE